MKTNSVKRIAILIPDKVLLLNVSGPADVFSSANHESQFKGGDALYELILLSAEGGSLRSSSGIEVSTQVLPDPDLAHFDTIAIAGGMGTQDMARDRRVIKWLQAMSPKTRRLASFGGGAFVLAKAGLLDMRHCVTHWRYGEKLRRSYPNVKVDADALFVTDGRVYTTAGSTAGIDLAMQLVEEDFGKSLSVDIARILLVARKRPGEQPQISAELQAQSASVPKIAMAAEWITDHIGDAMRIPDLARRFAMSERNFSRRFKLEFGKTPRVFIDDARVETARRWLLESSLPLDAVAHRAGYSCASHMTKSFRKKLGRSPSEIRSG